MRTSAETKPRSKPRRYVVAVVLGTALSALGSAPGLAAEEVGARTVHDISRYCTACWRNARLQPDCWQDCTQEVFCRLLERVAPDSWCRVLNSEGDERREFLRAIDAVKKRSQRSRKLPTLPDPVADRRDPRERRLADEREAVWSAAEQLLSARQQRILQLSLEGSSVHDIGEDLRVSAERVSDEKYKAIRKLRRHFGSPEPSEL